MSLSAVADNHAVENAKWARLHLTTQARQPIYTPNLNLPATTQTNLMQQLRWQSPNQAATQLRLTGKSL